MRLSTIMRPFRTQESSPDMVRRAAKELFAQTREYLTAAKKEYQRMTLRKVSFSECVRHFPASTEMFSFITSVRFLFPKS
jgi:hypothetical protein